MFLLALAACMGLANDPEKPDGQNLDETGSDSADTTGGGDTGDTTNHAPTADAGDDLTGSVGGLVVLDGSGSSDPENDPLGYSWDIVSRPGGSVAVLSSGSAESPTFIPDVTGSWTFELVVTDGALESGPDEVELVVADTGGAPTADAGADQSVTLGATVYLDGSSSYDPDGDPLLYTWTMTSQPSSSATALAASTSATPHFLVDAAGTYTVSLVVSDGVHTSAADTVTINATDSSSGGDSGCGCRTFAPGDAGLGALVGAVWFFRPRRRRAP